MRYVVVTFFLSDYYYYSKYSVIYIGRRERKETVTQNSQQSFCGTWLEWLVVGWCPYAPPHKRVGGQNSPINHLSTLIFDSTSVSMVVYTNRNKQTNKHKKQASKQTSKQPQPINTSLQSVWINTMHS